MYLVQLLLPLRDNQGTPFSRQEFEQVRQELTDRFGGVTSFLQSPATGLWKEGADEAPQRDELVLFEVMTGALNRAWWSGYRNELEGRFRQREIVIRALGAESL